MPNYARRWKVQLSSTNVFPPGTVLLITPQGEGYSVDVSDAGSCAPETNPLAAVEEDGRLVSQAFTSKCETSGSDYHATFAVIGPRRLAGEVDFAATKLLNGNPTGTYTAEEEGGGDVRA